MSAMLMSPVPVLVLGRRLVWREFCAVGVCSLDFVVVVVILLLRLCSLVECLTRSVTGDIERYPREPFGEMAMGFECERCGRKESEPVVLLKRLPGSGLSGRERTWPGLST
jgi:hypothetical protein